MDNRDDAINGSIRSFIGNNQALRRGGNGGCRGEAAEKAHTLGI